MGVVLFNTSLKWPQAHFINQGWICAEQGSVNETYLDCAKFHSLAITTVMKVAKKMNWKIFTLKAIWLALTNILQSFNSLIFPSFFPIWTESRKMKIPNEGWNSVFIMESGAHTHKWECREIWYSCARSPRGKFFTYIWLCIVSIPQLAMWISAFPPLIQAGHRGCRISRAILKYSTAVRD